MSIKLVKRDCEQIIIFYIKNLFKLNFLLSELLFIQLSHWFAILLIKDCLFIFFITVCQRMFELVDQILKY